MKKSDLKCGYLVRIADGRLLLLVQLENEIGLFDENNNHITEYKDYLSTMEYKYINECYGIIEVYGYSKGGELFNTNTRKLLWSRKDGIDKKEYEIDSQIHMIEIVPNFETYKECDDEYLTAVRITYHYDNEEVSVLGLSIDNMKDMIKAFTEIIDCVEGDK